MVQTDTIKEEKKPEKLLDKLLSPVPTLPEGFVEEPDEDEDVPQDLYFTRQEAVDQLVQDDLDIVTKQEVANAYDFLYDVFRYGVAGYENMTVAELEDELNDRYSTETEHYLVREDLEKPRLNFLEMIREDNEKKKRSILDVFSDKKVTEVPLEHRLPPLPPIEEGVVLDTKNE